MPLQNRVDPFGAIHAVASRGSMMGNRGVIHDGRSQTLLKRRWTTKAWIVCLCEFGGRHRDVMGPRTYTELFFLDEATAFAAGHRPCFECRRASAKAFAAAFARGKGTATVTAGEMDLALHGERMAVVGRGRPIASDEASDLPDGAMIAAAGTAYLIIALRAWRWSFDGYAPARPIEDLGDDLDCITPWSTVAALRHGYRSTMACAETT